MRLILMRVRATDGTEREIRAIGHQIMIPTNGGQHQGRLASLPIDPAIKPGETVLDIEEGSPLAPEELQLECSGEGLVTENENYRRLLDAFEELRSVRVAQEAGATVDLGNKIA